MVSLRIVILFVYIYLRNIILYYWRPTYYIEKMGRYKMYCNNRKNLKIMCMIDDERVIKRIISEKYNEKFKNKRLIEHYMGFDEEALKYLNGWAKYYINEEGVVVRGHIDEMFVHYVGDPVEFE